MKKIHAAATLALVLGGNAWAHEDGKDACSCTHWYQELDPSWYAGVSAGQTTFKDWSFGNDANDGSFTSRSQDDRETGWRVFAGVDLGRYLAIELGYADFGEATFRAQSDGSGSVFAAGPVTESVTLEAFDLALLGKLPLTEELALFGKVGVFQWESTYDASATFQCCGPLAFGQSDDHTDLSYGAGVQYDGFRPLRVVAEYIEADFSDKSPTGPTFDDRQVEGFTLSLAYLFPSE